MTARKVHIVLILVCVLLPFTASAQVAPSRPSYKLTPLPRDLEIELALSALPPHLRDDATVYVLNPAKGFEVARTGANEFHALVARTGDDTFRGSWPFTEYRDDILYPIGFDKAGANAQMRVFLDAAELQAKGTPATELKTIIKERYATKHYRSPERAGVDNVVTGAQNVLRSRAWRPGCNRQHPARHVPRAERLERGHRRRSDWARQSLSVLNHAGSARL